jgi:hypothetical protein
VAEITCPTCGRTARRAVTGWVCDACGKPVIRDLNGVRYARTVMHFYDKFERAEKREQLERKAEVEREARKRW